MSSSFAEIQIENVSLDIPVFVPGQQRLIRAPKVAAKVGARISSSHGKITVAALRNINLHLKQNEHLAIIGHNGAGKSTLLRVIAGIYPPTTGSVRVVGSIGCLIEMSIGMSEDMTGVEYVKYHTAVFANDLGQWRDVVNEVADFTELGPFMDMPIRTYSTGMRTRLAAALATAWPRDILVIDEGIGAGDAAFHAKFETRLRNFLQSASLLVFASHSTQLLQLYCSKGLVLERGEMKFFGPLDDALAYYAQSNQ